MLSSVREAAQRIHGAIYYTPCPYSAKLSELTGQKVYLKLENLQRTGAFKERGALNKILLLGAEERKRGVIAASAGNHAQAVACHATQTRNSHHDRNAGSDAAGEGDGHAKLRRGSDFARREL